MPLRPDPTGPKSTEALLFASCPRRTPLSSRNRAQLGLPPRGCSRPPPLLTTDPAALLIVSSSPGRPSSSPSPPGPSSTAHRPDPAAVLLASFPAGGNPPPRPAAPSPLLEATTAPLLIRPGSQRRTTGPLRPATTTGQRRQVVHAAQAVSGWVPKTLKIC